MNIAFLKAPRNSPSNSSENDVKIFVECQDSNLILMQIYSLKEMGIFVRNGIEHNNHVIYTFNGL